MFNDEKIKLIKTMPEGDKIIVIWVQLLCLAGKTNDGGLVYMGQNMAYTEEMFATLFDEKLNVVRIALQALEGFGLIEISDNGVIGISNWEKHQSTDKMAKMREQNRLRKRKYDLREKVRRLGYDPDAKGVPDTVDELDKFVEGIENENDTPEIEEPEAEGHNNNDSDGNVTVTTRNDTEVRSKKKEVRSKKLESNSPDSAKAKYGDDSPYIKLAKRLYYHIKERNPKQKEPNWQTWADDFRKTAELDERDIDEMTNVLDWCQKDSFWKNNILSPAKFRKQYDQLFLKMKDATGYGGESYGGLEF